MFLEWLWMQLGVLPVPLLMGRLQIIWTLWGLHFVNSVLWVVMQKHSFVGSISE